SAARSRRAFESPVSSRLDPVKQPSQRQRGFSLACRVVIIVVVVGIDGRWVQLPLLHLLLSSSSTLDKSALLICATPRPPLPSRAPSQQSRSRLPRAIVEQEAATSPAHHGPSSAAAPAAVAAPAPAPAPAPRGPTLSTRRPKEPPTLHPPTPITTASLARRPPSAHRPPLLYHGAPCAAMSTAPPHTQTQTQPQADATAHPSTVKSIVGSTASDHSNGNTTGATFLNYETVVPAQSSSSQALSTAAQGDSTQNRSLLNVPQSGSQNNDAQSPNTGLSGATAADAESIGRASKHSKRSFGMGKRRAGSVASSKRSHHRAAEKGDVPPVPAPTSRAGSTRSRAKKSGGLLSCLPCFAPKESREAGDATPPENVKQAQNLPTGRTSQSTPVKKQAHTATESSNTDSKDVLDEKAGAAAFTPGGVEKPNDGDGTTEHPAAENRPQIVTRSSSKRQQQADAALPNQPGALETGHPQISITNPTPAATPVLPRPSVEQQRIIEDQTEEQKQIDDDIEMKDVPLSTNDVHQEGEDQSTDAQPDHPKVDLPPPPPLVERQQAVQSQVTDVSEASEPQKYLLGPIAPRFKGKKCLVLDLDETLVHSSFKILHQADFTIPVEIEGQYHNVYVIKRPGVDQFMKRVGELYEVVYGDPLLDQLDIHGVVHHRLFRESCYNHQGNYVKDLSQIGRDLKDTIIIDNSPTSYIFHPQHAVPISSWFSDAHDNELLDLIPVLEDLAGNQVSDVSLVLDVAL
ncbi:hypothetical protein J1614_008202, partial [Plenodomus biglobosus]